MSEVSGTNQTNTPPSQPNQGNQQSGSGRTSTLAIVGLALIAILSLGMVTLVANSSPVFADSCTVQLGYPTMLTTYSSSGFQISVPVSANCPFVGGQIYSVGNVVDSSGTNLGSTTVVLNPIGTNVFNGLLVFTIPLPDQGTPVQISVSLYSNGPNGAFLASATETTQVYAPYYCNYPSAYCSYPWYPSYPIYPIYPSPPPHHHWVPPHSIPPHH